ncbi:MAG: IgGFc-binding protein [Labilithrix sp.]|nr:IgGFc-binding protein [Labilithrix sp.]
MSAYSIWPYGGTGGQFPAATLLLPTDGMGHALVAVNPWTTGNNSSSSKSLGWPFLQIVAAEDDTEVTIRPNVNIAAGRWEAVPRRYGVYVGSAWSPPRSLLSARRASRRR